MRLLDRWIIKKLVINSILSYILFKKYTHKELFIVIVLKMQHRLLDLNITILEGKD
jgi:hypothetical protein